MKITLLVLALSSSLSAVAAPREIVSASGICERELFAPSAELKAAQKNYERKHEKVRWLWRLRNMIRRAGNMSAQQALFHKYLIDHPEQPQAYIAGAIRKIFPESEDQATALLGWMDLQVERPDGGDFDEFITNAQWMRKLTGERTWFGLGRRRYNMPSIIENFVAAHATTLSREQIEDLRKVDPEAKQSIYVNFVISLVKAKHNVGLIKDFYNDLGPENYSSTLANILQQWPQYARDPNLVLALSERATDAQAILEIYLHSNAELLSGFDLFRVSMRADPSGAFVPPVRRVATGEPAPRLPTIKNDPPLMPDSNYFELSRRASSHGLTFQTFLSPEVLELIHRWSPVAQVNWFLQCALGSRDEKEEQIRDTVFAPLLHSQPPSIATTAEILSKITKPEIRNEMLESYASAIGKTPAERAELELKIIQAMGQHELVPVLLQRRAQDISLNQVARFLESLSYNPQTLVPAIDDYLARNFEPMDPTQTLKPELQKLITDDDPVLLIHRLRTEPDVTQIHHALALYVDHYREYILKAQQLQQEHEDQVRFQSFNKNYRHLTFAEVADNAQRIHSPDLRFKMVSRVLAQNAVEYEDFKTLIAPLGFEQRPALIGKFIASADGLTADELDGLLDPNADNADTWNVYADSQLANGDVSAADAAAIVRRIKKPSKRLAIAHKFTQANLEWSAKELAPILSLLSANQSLQILKEFLKPLNLQEGVQAQQILPLVDLLGENERDLLILWYIDFTGAESEATKLEFPDPSTFQLLDRIKNDAFHDDAYSSLLLQQVENIDEDFPIEDLLGRLRLPKSKGDLIRTFTTNVVVNGDRVIDLAEIVERFDPNLARNIRLGRKR